MLAGVVEVVSSNHARALNIFLYYAKNRETRNVQWNTPLLADLRCLLSFTEREIREIY